MFTHQLNALQPTYFLLFITYLPSYNLFISYLLPTYEPTHPPTYLPTHLPPTSYFLPTYLLTSYF
jgi:hypothetical protein